MSAPTKVTVKDRYTVGDVMTCGVATLRRNDELAIADDLMKQKRIRHLPVLDDDGELVGIVSQRDLFRGALAKALGYGASQQQKMMAMLVVKEVMATELVTTRPDARLSEAARAMMENKIGCLPVLHDGQLVGILTEGDFVAWAVRRSDA
jgi:CBS domain-containing membrane protein